jgi:hypothetical protein
MLRILKEAHLDCDMPKPYQQALQLASSLDPQDKLHLIAALSQQLLETEATPDLDQPGAVLPPEAIAELSRRMEALDQGEASTAPWREVMGKLREKYT